MKASACVVISLSLIYLLPASVLAQVQGSTGATLNNNPYDMIEGVWIVAGKVKNVQGDPIKGAFVTVTPVSTAGLRTLFTDGQGEFRTEYQLITGAAGGEFSVILAVKKKGFQTTHAYVNYGRSERTWVIPLTLQGLEEDPDLLSPRDLISGVAPTLRQLGSGDGLATKSEKDYARGVSAFLDQHNPERAVPLLFKVTETNPSCTGCRMMLGLAELGWCDWDDADRAIAESVKATLADRKLGRPEALLAYGTKLSWQHEPEKAEPFFLEALKFAPRNALALQELGRTLLALQKFEAANDVLRKALAAGAGPEARLLYAESWLGAGRTSEATAELNRYLDGRDVKNMTPRVRQLWVSIQNRQKLEAKYAKTPSSERQGIVDFLYHPPGNLIPGLEPAAQQEALSSILDRVGAKILEMTKDFPNTSSVEEIDQERVGRRGGVSSTQSQKFQYLCLVPRGEGGLGFIEYRADFSGNLASPKGLEEGFMLTKGFASAELVFHPAFRSESTFRYLGQERVNGRNTLVVAYAQIPGKAHLSGIFRQRGASVVTLSQGLAWIDPATYQILRLHTDLLAPQPELRLEGEATNIDFNAVHFKNVPEALWLPQEVTVTLNWRGKVLRNRHKYSGFRLFNVDASENIGKPKISAAPSLEAQEPTITP